MFQGVPRLLHNTMGWDKAKVTRGFPYLGNPSLRCFLRILLHEPTPLRVLILPFRQQFRRGAEVIGGQGVSVCGQKSPPLLFPGNLGKPIDHLVAKFNRIEGKDIAGVSDEVLARLMEHDYPGNVRELENIIEQAFVLCRGGLIELGHLPPELRPADGPAGRAGRPLSLQSLEKTHIAEALQRRGGSRKLAAKDLGIDVSTLYRKIKSLGIDTPVTDGRGKRK